MTLRKHQAAVADVCRELCGTSPIREIILSVTPGGGKSFVPVILADNLIPAIADKICWIVPRNALKYQGEAEFLNPRWGTSVRIRAVDGPQELSRGCEGFVTTYQAVGVNPEVYAKEFRWHRYILFLDEFHHVAEGEQWHIALQQLYESAALVVLASGTLSRGDGQRIAFMPYTDGKPDLSNAPGRRCITYTRGDAIREGAILKTEFKTIDGDAEWEEQDGARITSNLSGEESAKALFTALRTEFANQLLNAALREYQDMMIHTYREAKLLVVAPNIEIAKAYYDYLQARGHPVKIATSEDTPEARKNIEDFKRGVFHILVTVAMAYEGLNVPEIAVICCLSHIRSVPWLEQCFARANRITPMKKKAVVYAPADRMFKKAVRMIEREQTVPLADTDALGSAGGQEEPGEGTGGLRPWIIPVESRAHLDGSLPETPAAAAPCPPSEAEKILRKNIRAIVKNFLDKQRPGNRMAQEKMLYRRIKQIVPKSIDHMSQEELENVWLWLRKEAL